MITFGVGSATRTDNDLPTRTHTMTVAAGDNRVLLIGVSSERGIGGVTSVSVNGSAATEIETSEVSGEGMASLWALANPPTGSITISANVADSDEPTVVGGVCAYSADFSTIAGTGVSDNGDSNAPRIDVPSATGTVIVGVFGLTNGNTVSASEGTLIYGTGGAGPADVTGGMSWAPGGPSAYVQWSTGTDDVWNAVGAILTEAGAATQIDVDASDSGAVGATETADVAIAVSTSDSGVIGSTEGASVASTITASDAGAIGGAETVAIVSTVDVSDSGAITSSDDATVSTLSHVDIDTADGGAIAATESADVAGITQTSVDTSDSGAIGSIDAAGLTSAITASDSGTVVVEEASLITQAIAASDSGAIGATEDADVDIPYIQQPGDVVTVRARPAKDFTVRWALWRADIKRQRIEPLSLALPTSGEISYDQNRTLSPHQMTLDISDPDALRLPGDFVIPELTLVDPDGNETVIPLGHYAITDPEITTTDARRTARLTGMDLTYLLSLATLPDGGYFGGNDASLHAMAVLLSFGIPFDMIDIPLSGVTVPVDNWYGPGSNRLRVVNDLLRIGGMEPLAATLAGVLTSRKGVSLHDLTPTVIYGTESGAYVVPPVSERQPLSEVRNQVVVVYESPGNDPTYGVATVTNEASPIHPDALGQAYGLNEPIVQGERITVNNLSGDPLVDGIVTSLLAIATLSRLASYWRPLTVETFVDNHLDDPVLGLDIHTQDTERYTGNWWQRGWTIPMGTRATVRRTVNRLERIA